MEIAHGLVKNSFLLVLFDSFVVPCIYCVSFACANATLRTRVSSSEAIAILCYNSCNPLIQQLQCIATTAVSLSFGEIRESTFEWSAVKNTVGIAREQVAIQRPQTRSTAARQVSNAHERDFVTNENV